MIKGAEINLRIGFRKKLINPKINPAANKVRMLPVKTKPGIK